MKDVIINVTGCVMDRYKDTILVSNGFICSTPKDGEKIRIGGVTLEHDVLTGQYILSVKNAYMCPVSCLDEIRENVYRGKPFLWKLKQLFRRSK